MNLNKLDLYLYEMEYKEAFDFELPCCFDEMLEMFIHADSEDQLYMLSLINDDWRQQVLEMIDGGIIDVDEEVKAKRSAVGKKQYAAKHYRINKLKKKRKKEEVERSIEGKKRKRMKPIYSKQRKTPTGRHKLEYNT